MSESFRPWRVRDDLPPGELVVDAVVHDREGFRIVMLTDEEPSRTLIVKWTGDPPLYRNVDESYLLALWNSFPGPKGETFYIVNDSRLMEQFHQQSLGAYREKTLTHYAIYTGCDCIDVISFEPPTVGWS
jgi:hypothetical protein